MKNPPNIVFILPDQLRADFLGYNGFRAITTPHLDALAGDSIDYAQAISACPLCVPARAALLTGMNSLKTGVISNRHWLRPDRQALGIQTWPELLSAAGYSTSAIGKMHFCPWEASEGFHHRVIAEDKRWPLIQDDYAGFLGAKGHLKPSGVEYPGYQEKYGAVINRLPDDETVDYFVASKACEYIRDYDQEGPFALMVGLPSPHCPYDPTQRSLDQVKKDALPLPIKDGAGDPNKDALYNLFLKMHLADWHQLNYANATDENFINIRVHYTALIKEVDEQVGRIIGALKEKGLYDDTLIVFSSDHGEFAGDRRRVGKYAFYESAIRIPLLVKVPGGQTKCRRDDLVELKDITATMLRFAGIEPPARMDSIALPGLGFDRPARETIVGVLDNQVMIRKGTWKMTRYAVGLSELFDLKNDPTEQTNLFAESAYRSVREDLEDALFRELFESVRGANIDRAFSVEDLTGSKAFGQRGWQRPYLRAMA